MVARYTDLRCFWRTVTDLPLHSHSLQTCLWIFNLDISTECEEFISVLSTDGYKSYTVILFVCVSTLDLYLNLNCRKLSRKRIVCFVAWCLAKPQCEWMRLQSFLIQITAPKFGDVLEKACVTESRGCKKRARRVITLALNTRFAGILQDSGWHTLEQRRSQQL